MNGDFHRFTAEAIGNTTVRLIKRQSLEREAKNDPAMIRCLLKMTTSNLRACREPLAAFRTADREERVGAFFLEMNDRQASADVIKLPMSRRDIADYLGLTLETVSRELSKFQRKGYLRFWTNAAPIRRTECRRPDQIRRISWRTQVGWVAVGLHNCFNYTSLGLQKIPGGPHQLVGGLGQPGGNLVGDCRRAGCSHIADYWARRRTTVCRGKITYHAGLSARSRHHYPGAAAKCGILISNSSARVHP